MSADALQADLWPDRLPKSPLASLHVIINRLRSSVAVDADELVEHDDRAYRLTSDAITVDIETWRGHIAVVLDAERSATERLSALDCARATWTGEPFAAFAGSPTLGQWRTELERQAVDADVLGTRLLIEEQRPGEAARRLATLSTIEPLREDIAAVHVEALSACGRPAEALRRAATYRERLRDEVGLSPSPTFAQLEQRIAGVGGSAPRPARAPQADESVPTSASGDDVLDGLSAAELLDRALELERAGDRVAASHTFDRVLATGTDDEQTLARAALGGTGHASRLGGSPDRRRRLGGVLRMLSPGGARDEVTVELALELVHSRRPLAPDLAADVARIATTPESRGHVLARRLTLVFDEMTDGASFDDAVSLVDVAMDRASPYQQTACLIAAVHVALTSGAWNDAERWAADLAMVAERSGEPRARWMARAYAASIADAIGQYDEANDIAGEALALGQSLDISDAPQTFALLHLGRAFRSGSIAPFAEQMEEATARYQFPVWFALRGVAAMDVGEERRARELFELAVSSLDSTRDTFRPAAIALSAELGARLGDTMHTARLADALEVRAGRLVFLGYGGPFIGTVDWYRARLAHASGSDDADVLARADAERRDALNVRSWSDAR